VIGGLRAIPVIENAAAVIVDLFVPGNDNVQGLALEETPAHTEYS
jgi:hypothetical protein